MANHNECSVCHACGCGTPLYLSNGKYFCKRHLPATQSKRDDQVLTPEQRSKYQTTVINVNIEP
jgi:hypothetical protein